jgi:hypothetical protein
VHVLELPVPLAARAQEHFEELMREFALITAGLEGEAHPEHVPTRLLRLVEALTQRFAGVTSEAEGRLAEAIASGQQVIEDHVLLLPKEAAEASEALGALIDEADEYCRQGEHLLTLASPADCVAYRQWYLGEVIGQLSGRDPVPWPESSEAQQLR